MEKFEGAVQSVKATLFDSVYREQGLVEILTKKMETFNPETQLRLGTLFTKQKEDIENILKLLDEFGIKMNDVLSASKEIMKISNEQEMENIVVAENSSTSEEVVSKTENVAVPGEDAANQVNGNAFIPADVEPVVTMNTGNDGSVVQNAALLVKQGNNVEGVSPSVATEAAVTIPGVVVDAASVGGEQVTAPVSAEPGVITGSEVISQPTMDIPRQEVNQNVQTPTLITPTIDMGTADESTNVPTGGNNVVDVGEQTVGVAAPANEVIQIPGQTGAIDDTSASAGFVLSPIDEDVVPTPPAETEEKKEMTPEVGIAAADQQLNVINTVKEEITNNPTLTVDEKAEALEKYDRLTANVVKAILVTKAQYEKLAASKITQKALLNVKQNGSGTDAVLPTIPETVPSTPVVASQNTVPNASVQADEQTLIANGLLEPTVQDKQKEMQAMMEQANALYKEGKTQEAQELFNKVSVMNKEIQSGSGGQALVKS